MFEELKNEIIRAYKILGPIKGQLQNDLDIRFWSLMKWVNEYEANELRAFNRELGKK